MSTERRDADADVNIVEQIVMTNGSERLVTPTDLHSGESAEETDPMMKVRTTEIEFKGDYHKYVYHLPQSFEDTWMSFDDFWISICQKFQWRVLKYFCKFVTLITSIEIGITTPYVLYVWGWDFLATVALYIILSVIIVSQIPKRFLFRKRPHVAGRAIKMSKTHTSSFPSRAVTCAIIYAAFICFAIRWINMNNPNVTFSFWFWIWPIVIAAFLITSFARIHLGVHYPSDCIFAALQAVICVTLGLGMYFLNLTVCPSCLRDNCYATAKASTIALTNLKHMNWLLFSFMTLFFLLISVITVAVINFFVKFHHVFGLTLPCLAFKMTMLCQRLSWDGVTSLARPPRFAPSWYEYLFALSSGIILTIVGMLAPKGKSSILTFFIMYATTFTALLLWRASYV